MSAEARYKRGRAVGSLANADNSEGCSGGSDSSWVDVGSSNICRIVAAARPWSGGANSELNLGATSEGMWKIDEYSDSSFMSCIERSGSRPG